MTAATALLTYLLKLAIAAQRPLPLYAGLDAYSFPSTHTTLSIAVYGFLAVLIARELTPTRRWAPYIGAALLVIPIAFSRLYFSVHWLSDVLGGLTVGLATLALFGIAYRRHPAQPLGWQTLLLISGVTLISASLWRFDGQPLSRYNEQRAPYILSAAQWWNRDWHLLPAQRQDIKATARQALNIQFAGDPAALAGVLAVSGWHTPTELSLTSALQWLVPHPEWELLPVLPQVNGGQHDVLRLVRPAPDGQGLYLVRLWPSHVQLRARTVPVWVGSISELKVHARLHLFTYLVNDSTSDEPLQSFRHDIGTHFESALRQRATASGTVLLVRER